MSVNSAQGKAISDAGLGAGARFALVFGGGLLLLLVLALIHIGQGQFAIEPQTIVQAFIAPDERDVAHNIVRHVRLPRVLIGLLAGGALALAGVLMQTATDNGLASPSTLGVNAGAYLALIAFSIFAPGLLDLSPLSVALLGGLLAAGLVYVVAASRTVTPARLVLAGVAVSLALSSIAAALLLLFENETSGLFLWGAGSLVQSDWSKVQYSLPRLLPGLLACVLLVRELDVLRLGDSTAQALGQPVVLVRLATTTTAVFLAAVAVSAVGPVGFIGLVVPHLVRLLGLVRHIWLLPGAALWGGIILVAADVVARWLNPGLSEIPAGVVTAMIGAPFLVWLARGTRAGGEGRRAQRSGMTPGLSRDIPYPLLLAAAAIVLLLALLAGVLLGAVPLSMSEVVAVLQGQGATLSRDILFTLRLPRLLVALASGAALAVSGLVLQGIVRNPLAAPSIVGVTSGAGLGGLLVLIALPQAPVGLLPLAAFAGALIAFGVTYAAAWQNGLSPIRLALIGVAVSAFCMAVSNWLVVQADVRVATALVWLAGSTYARGWSELLQLVAWPAVLVPLVWALAPRLDLMALGDDAARGLGLSLEHDRAVLLLTAVLLAAAAVATVGTVSFVGLMAPHAARLLAGSRHRRLVALTAILGALLVVLADTVGRTALAPKEIPTGLVTALLGAPYFLWLLWRSEQR